MDKPLRGKSQLTSRVRPARLTQIVIIGLLLFAIGRVGEVIGPIGRLPVVKVLLALALLAILFRGRAVDLAALRSRAMVLVWLFASCCCLSLLYSVWRAETFRFLTTQLPVLLVLSALIAGTTVSIRRLQVVAHAVMLLGVPLALAAAFDASAGRVQLGATYDPNDLAFLMAALLPFVYVRSRLAAKRSTRWICYGVAVAYLSAAVLTQSRGGMIGIALMAIYLSWKGVGVEGGAEKKGKAPGKKGRLGRLCLLAIVGVAGAVMAPPEAKERLGTIFDLSNDYNVTATDNDNGRLAIWRRAASIAIDKPWGVGANAYPAANFAAGGIYITVHNSELQAFVEVGVLGGILYIAILISTWRLAGASYRRALESGPSAGRSELLATFAAIKASLIAIVVSGFFLSQAYALILYVIVAMTVASARILDSLIAQSRGFDGGVKPTDKVALAE